ncbi:hypothetical protein [Streptomyces sp. NPDC055287]
MTRALSAFTVMLKWMVRLAEVTPIALPTGAGYRMTLISGSSIGCSSPSSLE